MYGTKETHLLLPTNIVEISSHGFRYALGMTAHTYVAGIPLLTHGLTVKFSPCQCSHNSLAGRVCVCIPNAICYSQARPRTIQHFSSQRKVSGAITMIRHCPWVSLIAGMEYGMENGMEQ